MRIIHAYFKGYAGFYHGMGLKELDIDLSKCKHNIVLIVGKNGCGKSTLEGALNIFPDNNSCFLNMDAQKRLKVLDGENVYDIQIDYPVDGNGNRKTTKALIQKNGIEMNPNGNVTSYKDILATEFDLDPNFITLSMLTSIDRGLGDKRPAERKKFVGSVIENLNTYNNIYKTLNKKSLIYKSHVNTIHTKIQSTGDKNALESSLNQLYAQESVIEGKIKECNDQIVAINAKNSTDEEELAKISELTLQQNELVNDLDIIKSSIGSYINKTKINPEDIDTTLEEDQKLLDTYTNKSTNLKNSWREKNDRLSNITSMIHNMEVTLSEANSSIDNTLEEKYAEQTKKVDNLLQEATGYGYTDTSLIPELTDIIDFCKRWVPKLEAFYDGLTPEDVKSITIDYDPHMNDKLHLESETLINKIEATKDEINKIGDNLKLLSVLDSRPKGCKITDCPFISDALKLSKTNTKKSLGDRLNELQEEIMKYSYSLTKTQENITNWNSMVPKRMEFQGLTTLVDNILTRYPQNMFLKNVFDKFDEKVANFYSFNDVKDMSKMIEALNTLMQLDEEMKICEVLKASYNSHREKVKLINSTKNTLADLKKEQEELNLDLVDIKTNIDSTNSLLSDLNSKIGIQSLYKEEHDKFVNKSNELEAVQKELEVFQKKSSKAMESIAVINQLQEKINTYQEELKPVKAGIADISGRLTLLNSYYAEYDNYNSSYQIIETLKKYCSPTGGGIQTLFMQLYMSKTLELSNQILAMLFNGDYQLIDFIINENEFRIPFIGNGLQVDDISSGSNSQICMMGMVINLVLLHQASTRYNIAYLDEIDSGLDHRNRFEFVDALYKSIPLLGIEQLFMISHSMETDTSSVDIIKLKGYDDFEDTIQMGNVIFDYSKTI